MDEQDANAILVREGCEAPRRWSNAPGDRYGRHDHPYHKVLFCLEGSVAFHLDDRDIELRSGDRLDLPPGTMHGATVGPAGCACVEGARSPPPGYGSDLPRIERAGGPSA